MKKILAITPFLSKSGSEISFVNLMNNLANEFAIKIFTPATNPQLMRELNKKIKLFQPERPVKNNKFESLLLKIRRKDRIKELLNEGQDLIFLNTLISLRYLQLEERKKSKKILYVHETEQMLVKLTKEDLRKVLNNIDLILCCSKNVREYLTLLGCKGQIEVLYPSINYENFHISFPKREIRQELGINSDSFIWVMSGALLLNKNPKAFINVAKELLQRNIKTTFLWIGATGNNAYEEYLKAIIKRDGLEGIIYIIPRKTEDYFDYLNGINGFLLSSYSESFSIAALEAVCFNKPVISFPNGGVYESVPECFRKVAKDFSISELADLMEDQMKETPKTISDPEIQHLLQFEQFSLSLKLKEYLRKHSLLH
jgi:glycosyltransferase involved in cell wall biosynthesis